MSWHICWPSSKRACDKTHQSSCHVIKFALEYIYAGCSWTNDNLNQQNSNDLTIITVYIY